MTDKNLQFFLEKKQKILLNSTQLAINALKDLYHCMKIKIGFELEFYLLDSDLNYLNNDIIENYIDEINKISSIKNICIIKKEQGKGQIEIATYPDDNLEQLCNNLDFIKNTINNLAHQNNFIASLL